MARRPQSIFDVGRLKLSKTAIALAAALLVVPYVVLHMGPGVFGAGDGSDQFGKAQVYLVAGKPDKGLPLLEKAAGLEHLEALQMLGVMLTAGEGMERDFERAKQMLALPAERRYKKALCTLGFIALNEREPGYLDTARDYYERALNDSVAVGYPDDATPQLRLGAILSNPDYPRRDYRQAAVYLEQAAEQGMDQARFILAVSYIQPDNQHFDKAFALFSGLAEEGHRGARVGLAYLYVDGLGVERDCAKAAELARPAAHDGDRHAMKIMAHLHATGCGVARDLSEAERWRRLAKEL